MEILKKQLLSKFMNTKIGNRYIFILLFLIFCVSLFGADSLKTNNQEGILHKSLSTLSLNEHISYENLLAEREIWAKSLDRSNSNNAIYATIIASLFLIFNVSLVIYILKQFEKKVYNNIQALENKLADYEENYQKLNVDMCRSVYIAMIANKSLGEAVIWGARIIKNEYGRSKKRITIIEGFIDNIKNLTDDLLKKSDKYMTKSDLREQLIKELYIFQELIESDYISKKHKVMCRDILNNIIASANINL